jgi:hypothetical protein
VFGFEEPPNQLLPTEGPKLLTRFPLQGFHKYSVAYSSNGMRRFNQPFTPTNYAPQYVQGDVIGVGYRPRTGTIFFTRNGKKLEDVVHGLKSQNFFPAVGANGPATVHVNFGQSGFVFIEANVKKWGLAPVTGSLAPPPPYGAEQGSILLEAGRKDGYTGSVGRGRGHTHPTPSFARQSHDPSGPGHNRTRSGNFRVLPPTSPGPMRSPTEISLAQLVIDEDVGEASGSGAAAADGEQSREEGQAENGLGVRVQQESQPPPDYTSPEHSEVDDDSRRNSSESDEAPLLGGNRSRGGSTATARPIHRPPPRTEDGPPIPSYHDAIEAGAGRDRSLSPDQPRRT